MCADTEVVLMGIVAGTTLIVRMAIRAGLRVLMITLVRLVLVMGVLNGANGYGTVMIIFARVCSR